MILYTLINNKNSIFIYLHITPKSINGKKAHKNGATKNNIPIPNIQYKNLTLMKCVFFNFLLSNSFNDLINSTVSNKAGRTVAKEIIPNKSAPREAKFPDLRGQCESK